MSPAEQEATQGRPGAGRKHATVMFADMVEYSKRIELDEANNSLRAARAIELFKDLVAHYGGKVANVAGDGILALFENADHALRFAIQVRSDFRDQSAWHDGEPIEFRFGLNLGEVSEHEGNVIGHCVNVASRIQMLAAPNDILITAGLRQALQEDPAIKLRPLGPQLLRNISQPTEVFAVESNSPAPISTEYVPAPLPRISFEPQVRAPTVAVLALTNLSGDARNDHMCEGIAEDIIFNLSRFRSLLVIARHSAFMFSLRATTAQEVQRRLGARYILTGSLRRSEKRLRIAVELIDAMSETVVWSDRFNAGLEDLFDVQDEIAAAVAARLSVQVEIAERRQESDHPRDMRAHGLLIRGSHLLLHFNREANSHARRLFAEAIEYAPQYSRAHSAMSRTHNLDWRYAWSFRPDESLDAAVVLARRATELDELDARGFAELGNAKLYKKQISDSLVDYEQALMLNPNDSDIIAEYADALVYAGRPKRSVDLLEKAMRLNPYYPDWYLWYLADAYDSLGQYVDVVATIQRMRNPSEGSRLLAIACAHLGLKREAEAAAAEVLRLHPHFTIGQWRQRPPFQSGDAFDRYVEGLRKAGLPE